LGLQGKGEKTVCDHHPCENDKEYPAEVFAVHGQRHTRAAEQVGKEAHDC